MIDKIKARIAELEGALAQVVHSHQTIMGRFLEAKDLLKSLEEPEEVKEEITFPKEGEVAEEVVA